MRHPPPKGFTLLELLIALALFGLVAVALSGGLRFAGHAIPEEQRRRAAFADLDAVESVLRRMIAEARSLDGTDESLDFIGSLPRALAAPGLYAIHLGTDEDRLVLVWRAVPDAAGQEPGEPLGEAELARNVIGLDLAYLSAASAQTATAGLAAAAGLNAASGNGPATWRPSIAAKTIPLLVRARLRLPSGDPRRWPELVVAPAIDVPPPNQR